VKRAVIRVTLFLLLGAIVNVAVAWGLCRTPKWNTPYSSKVATRVDAEQWWQANALASFPRDRELIEVMEWKRFANRYWAVSTFTHSADRFESGWPLYALERSHWTKILEVYQHRHALPLTPWLAEWLGTEYLPLRPIWPGFVINTLLYAAILWLLFVLPFALRHRSRIRRGLCPQCAYPIGASDTCTECGAGVKTRNAA
jgi:hypothetical protein